MGSLGIGCGVFDNIYFIEIVFCAVDSKSLHNPA